MKNHEKQTRKAAKSKDRNWLFLSVKNHKIIALV